MRDLLLYNHPWNFALKRADISAQLSTTPAFEFDYAYTVPVDCLRVLELYGSDADWVIESGLLLTNQAEDIHIKYIRTVETTGSFNPGFVNCFATRLGAELAAKIKGDAKKRLALLKELIEIDLPAARRMNSIEGRRPLNKEAQGLDKGNFSWQTHGYAGGQLTDEVYTT